jgi:hypothetical protein
VDTYISGLIKIHIGVSLYFLTYAVAVQIYDILRARRLQSDLYEKKPGNDIFIRSRVNVLFTSLL